MRKFGIIAEGPGDCAVLQNILRGLELIEKPDDVEFLRPRLRTDMTDRSQMNANEFSSWTLVKKECVERDNFRSFFDDNIFDEERKMIVQIDSAECELEGYDVERPDKNSDNYCEELRTNIIDKINEWLENEFTENIHYAICVEETEAWVMTLYGEKDTYKYPNPKERFQGNVLNKYRRANNNFKKAEERIKQKKEFVKAEFYSSDFQKLKRNKIKGCLKNNPSLKAFVDSLSELKEAEEI